MHQCEYPPLGTYSIVPRAKLYGYYQSTTSQKSTIRTFLTFHKKFCTCRDKLDSRYIPQLNLTLLLSGAAGNRESSKTSLLSAEFVREGFVRAGFVRAGFVGRFSVSSLPTSPLARGRGKPPEGGDSGLAKEAGLKLGVEEQDRAD